MRLLENAQIEYRMFEYPVDDGLIDAVSIARKIGENVEQVFKTLVTQSASREHFVFVVPANAELDLKKAASVSSLPPFFKGYFVGLPNRYTFFYRQEHRVFFCHVECLIPSTDLRQCTVYAPFAQ